MMTLTAELPSTAATLGRLDTNDADKGKRHLRRAARRTPSELLQMLAGADGARHPQFPRRRFTP